MSTFLLETPNLLDISYGARKSRNICKSSYVAESYSQKEEKQANRQQTEKQKLRTRYDNKIILKLSFPNWEIKKPVCVLASPYREAE